MFGSVYVDAAGGLMTEEEVRTKISSLMRAERDAFLRAVALYAESESDEALDEVGKRLRKLSKLRSTLQWFDIYQDTPGMVPLWAGGGGGFSGGGASGGW